MQPDLHSCLLKAATGQGGESEAASTVCRQGRTAGICTVVTDDSSEVREGNQLHFQRHKCRECVWRISRVHPEECSKLERGNDRDFSETIALGTSRNPLSQLESLFDQPVQFKKTAEEDPFGLGQVLLKAKKAM